MVFIHRVGMGGLDSKHRHTPGTLLLLRRINCVACVSPENHKESPQVRVGLKEDLLADCAPFSSLQIVRSTVTRLPLLRHESQLDLIYGYRDA